MRSISFSDSDGLSIAIVLLSYLMYSIGDTTTKYVLQFYDIVPTMFLNGVFVMSFMLIYGLMRRGPSYFKTQKIKHHLFKASLGVILGFAALYALDTITLSEFYLMIFTAPLWVVIMSWFMLGEKLDIYRSSVVVLGFCVILYVFMPNGEFSVSYGALAALLCAILAAYNMVFIRKYLRGEPPALIGGFNSTVIAIVLAVFVIPDLHMGYLQHLHLFALIGFCILSGTVLLARAFHMTSQTVILAPIHYIQMIYGVLFGYFVFAEIPTSRTVIGSLALAGLGLCLFWYDYKKNKKKKQIA